MSQVERFKITSGTNLLLIKDNKILLSRRYNTGFQDGNYGLVGGHLNGKETLKDAIAREAKEEAGISISKDDLRHAVTVHRMSPDRENLDVFFVSNVWEGDVTNLEPDRCDDLSWFPLHDLPSNTIHYIKAAIECYAQEKPYLEFGWEK